ncbi:MAG: septum formation protein Maf [Candidatus Dadabacteria bacterium RIFCSPHIGHO2_12_FULL_53_21]|nr:MAG: septum formation protein Maf [Candidatus Dadabacteria bacterium RIFCSPHIGHO2_12_FULL_53_21]
MNYRIVLASSSPRRRELLSTLGLGFDVIHPSSDETVSGNETPEDFVLRVSAEKASSVSRTLGEGVVVIGADTVVVVDGEILGKPRDPEDASSMLRKLSGKEHHVYTAFSIVRPKNEILHSEIVDTSVRVKPLAASEIEGYIKTGEPMDKAGAYGIQGIGAFMVGGFEGSYSNVVGLPVEELLAALKKLGIV